MAIRDIFITACAALFLTPILFLSLSLGYAQVRQSTNYTIEADSINFGGGFSSSTNYTLESTGGELGTGNSSSTNYAMSAGYQQMTTRYIAMTTPDAVTMTPTLVGIGGATSTGSTTVTVTTDSAAGYMLTIRGAASPAMIKGGDSIADYVPGGSDPDFNFTVDADEAFFGYSPSGNDTVARFKDDGAALCSTGSSETVLACWDGLSTSDETIAQSSAANNPQGATTTVYFRTGLGSAVVQPPGVYVATTTLTATAL